MRKNIVAPIALLAALAGCAFDDPRFERMTVTSDPNPGIECTLWNDLGQWTITTPGTVLVRRSAQPLKVQCEGAALAIKAYPSMPNQASQTIADIVNPSTSHEYRGNATMQAERK